MAAKIKDRGRYEFFESDDGLRILALNHADWFAWIENDDVGEMLVRTDGDHVRAKTIHEGDFAVLGFEDDPRFRRAQNLWLELEGSYYEFLLPRGMPAAPDAESRIVRTPGVLDPAEVRALLDRPAPEAIRGDGRAPVAGYERLSVERVRDRLDRMSRTEVELLRGYEQEHKNRKTLLRAIDRRLER